MPVARVSRVPAWFRARPDRRRRVATALVLAVSLALRLAFIAGRHAAPFSDMVGYEERALLLLRGGTFQAGGVFGATYRGPGYLVFLAALFGLGGSRWWVAYLVQSLLGVATLLGIQLLGSRLFSPRVGLIALVLAAGYLPFLAYAQLLLPETLFVCFVVFCVYAVVRGVQGRSSWWMLAGGALCGAAALTRSVALLLPVALVVWLALTPRSPPARAHPLWSTRSLRGLLAFVGAMLVILAPWVARNAVEQHRFIPGDTVGGLNLLIGNHAGAEGTFDERVVWTNPAVRVAVAQGKREAALDAVFLDQALVWIDAHPADFLLLTGRRALYFASGVRDWVMDGMGSHALDTLSGASYWYTWALLSLALVGGVAGLLTGRLTVLPLACFVYFSAVVAVFYWQARYRLPAMPFAILLAAHALDVVAGGGKRGIAVGMLAVLGAVGLSHLSAFYGV